MQENEGSPQDKGMCPHGNFPPCPLCAQEQEAQRVDKHLETEYHAVAKTDSSATKTPPQFVREFSRERSAEERQQTAEAIRAKRVEHFSEKRVQAARQSEIQQTTSERERVLNEQQKAIEQLEIEITELSTSGIKKILNFVRMRKLRADAAVGQRTYEELLQLQNTEIAEEQAISEKRELEKISPALQEAKAMLDDFYRRQKEKWTDSEYTKEDITKYFSEEHLSSLSLEDYALLLKRFPSEMVAHVTRQGIRDHIGMIYHSAGEGEYIKGFMNIVEDGRLRSPLGVYLVEGEKEQAIGKFLGLDELQDKDEALRYLDTLTTSRQGEGGSYADRMAVHFATEEVADSYYGSEKGNEIFIAYPSAYIASQYYFNGQLNEGGGGYWNDQWVWANEERGMDINAGLVFVPEEADVDRKTGSRYELDEDNNPIQNSDYQAAFRRVVDSVDFGQFADQVTRITGKMNQELDDSRLSPENRKLLQQLEPFRQRLETEFGVTDRRLQDAILDYDSLFRIEVQKKAKGESAEDPINSIDSMINRALRKKGILFAEAKNTVPSKEFWEAYFAKNPAKRPSKIVYYKGASPTRTLWQWRKEQGIDKKAQDKDMGFSERNIQRDAPQATAGLDRFRTLAEKVINDYFSQKEPALVGV